MKKARLRAFKIVGKKGEIMPDCSYEIVRKGEEIILKVDSSGCTFPPSLEDSAECMEDTCNKLVEAGNITKIVFSEKRDYEYDYDQTRMVTEVARLFSLLSKQKSLLGYGLISECIKCAHPPPNEAQQIVLSVMKRDPIGCYVSLKRLMRDYKIKLQKELNSDCESCYEKHMIVVKNLVAMMEKLSLISKVKEEVAGYKIGERDLYRKIFSPMIKPNFMYTKLTASYPDEAEELDSYDVGDTEVTIFSAANSVKYLYHMVPPEFKLSEEKYDILDTARRIMSEHKPQRQEFIDPERMREVFFNIGKDLIEQLATFKSISMTDKEVEELTNILIRYTVGFGLIEILLQDEKVQDITMNSPMGVSPMYIVHQDYDDCDTNIVPTHDEAESWATKLRLMSGRPLDEANPVLDTELQIPGAFSRVAVITSPLNPSGLAFAFRRHREKPWTLPLFIKQRMINPLGAGIISFMIDGSRTMIVAGTRSAGKTSFLGSLMVEIMRRYRIITIEDSVTGDCEMLTKRNGIVERTTVGSLINSMIENYGCWYNLTGHEILGNDENIEILSMDKEGKIKWARPVKMIRHKTNKHIYEIITRTGRKIKVTEDHSVFGLGEDAQITEAKVKNLKVGDKIAVPRVIPNNAKNRKRISLLDCLEKLKMGYVYGEGLSEYLRLNKNRIMLLAKERGHNKSTALRWIRKKILPASIINELGVLNNEIELKDAYYKVSKNSEGIPLLIDLDETTLSFMGLWLADGCYDKASTIVSVVKEENREVVRNIASKYGFNVKMHSDKFSMMINSKTLKHVLMEVFELKENSYTKRVPGWVFSLSKEQAASVMKGLFSGDGCVSDKEIIISLCSRKMLEDIQTLLLNHEIIMRIGTFKIIDKTFRASISALSSIQRFREAIGIHPYEKAKKLQKLSNKVSTHDSTDVVPLDLEDKKFMSLSLSDMNYHDYVARNNSVGRVKLQALTTDIFRTSQFSENLHTLAHSDILWDSIREINVIENFNGYVYDFSVPECESFVCGNIVAHNTLELPSRALQKLGYNIQQMKVASALTKGTTEVPADEGIRATLRLGDSGLIVGEVRSKEALALYEAMRVGALANVVAGTIHADSAYGVFDRVVNDLGVPRTSFKATDAVIVANPIKSADGIHKWRRITQITEVRKHWEQDPMQEGGFVDLMSYDAKKDELVPSKDLMNGDSDVLKSIASKVKEWSGNWDAVWENIMLRANIKNALVEAAEKTGDPDILEAKFVIQANDVMHRMSDEVRTEVGSLDNKMIYSRWEEWLNSRIKQKKVSLLRI